MLCMADNFLQVLQFLFVFIAAFFIVYSVVRNFKSGGRFVKHIQDKNCTRTVIIYVRSLCAVDYKCFHKYQIWRCYRFS